jgi:hypothetical protein
MKTLFACMLSMFFINACAQTGGYTHATKNADDFERERYECEKIATHKAEDQGASGNPNMVSTETDRCLKVKFGWVPRK